jgi:hypothetical protein
VFGRSPQAPLFAEGHVALTAPKLVLDAANFWRLVPRGVIPDHVINLCTGFSAT